jgi:RNA polymerase sigma-70 factor (ECF subfamily)
MKPVLDLSDDQLVLLALEGDGEAFDALMGRYQDYIFHLCWRVTRIREDAEDLTQECFLKLHQHLHRLKPGNKLGNWLYTVALNDCRKRLRRRRLAAFFSLDARNESDSPLIDEPRSTFLNPEQQAVNNQGRAILATCVDALAEDMRTAIVLRYEMDQDIPDIARILGRSEVATRGLLHRARLRLHKVLALRGMGGLTPPPPEDILIEEGE